MRRYYPEYIKKYVKERLNLEDTKENDEYVATLTPNEVFECVLEWNGICNYGETLKVWVKDIYGVDLNDKSLKEKNEPKMPFMHGIEEYKATCPHCNKWIEISPKRVFCCYCGQRLNWSFLKELKEGSVIYE